MTFDLERFVDAQDPVHDRVLAELAAGRKASHWMWFVFPQIAGLGTSAMSQLYAVASLDEARAYLAHPVLGPRLRQCTRLVLAAAPRTATAIFGSVDAAKLRSSMTLFDRAEPGSGLFDAVLAAFFDGEPDPLTLDRLAR